MIAGDIFYMKGRRFRVTSNLAHNPIFPKTEKQIGNAVVFIETVEEKELGETFWKDIPPLLIKVPKSDLEKEYNRMVIATGEIWRPVKVMDELIDIRVVQV